MFAVFQQTLIKDNTNFTDIDFEAAFDPNYSYVAFCYPHDTTEEIVPVGNNDSYVTLSQLQEYIIPPPYSGKTLKCFGDSFT